MSIEKYIEYYELIPVAKKEFNKFILSNSYTLKEFYDNKYQKGVAFYKKTDLLDNGLDSLYEIVDLSKCRDQKEKYNQLLEFALYADEMYVEALDDDKVLIHYYWS